MAVDMKRLLQTSAPRSVFLIRLVVGGVFLSEGIQKFLYPAENGAGRFARIGIPAPEVMGPFVGVVEIVCGALLLAGLLTRLAAVPLIIDMLVAILSTKIPILVGHGFWGFSLRTLPYYGFWGMLHEARTDFAMLFGSIFLLLVGAGLWSIDARLVRSVEQQTRDRAT
jgi:putative oxidoreductase